MKQDLVILIDQDYSKWQEVDDIEKQIKQSCLETINFLNENLDKSLQNLEISILLTSDDNIQELNKNYRGKNRPTNVLSFPQDSLFQTDKTLLGDIILSFQTIYKEAKEQDKSFNDHLKHLVVHGTLHLLGYDHEEDNEAEEMESLEISILKKLDVKNPY